MFTMKNVLLCTLLSALLALSGCANYGGSDYTGNQAQRAQNVQYGTITGIRDAEISGTSAGKTIGTVGGGVAGGVLGSMVGGGRGQVLSSVAGAMLGAGAGYLGGEALTSKKGVEIEIALENGGTISVIQGAGEDFSVGERVRVLTSSDGHARVTR